MGTGNESQPWRDSGEGPGLNVAERWPNPDPDQTPVYFTPSE